MLSALEFFKLVQCVCLYGVVIISVRTRKLWMYKPNIKLHGKWGVKLHEFSGQRFGYHYKDIKYVQDENNVLMRLLEYYRKDVTVWRRKYISKKFIICILHQLNENEMSGTCSTYVREKICIGHFSRKSEKEKKTHIVI